jgi:hypothetical protein
LRALLKRSSGGAVPILLDNDATVSYFDGTPFDLAIRPAVPIWEAPRRSARAANLHLPGPHDALSPFAVMLSSRIRQQPSAAGNGPGADKNHQGETMNRLLLRVLGCLALITCAASSLLAQTTTFVSPVPFYRFRVSNTNLGYLYTASFQEGVNAGFTPDGALHNSNGIIGYIVVPPAQNATPNAGQGLVPLHRLRVIESGRAYWYLTTTLGSYGSNYTYEGIAGYAFNLADTTHAGLTFTAYYSQRYGYWFALNGERPPDASLDFSPYGGAPSPCDFVHVNPANGLYYCSSYSNHGAIAKLPQSQIGSFAFTTPPPPPPPPPPGECTAGSGIKAKCSQLGGTWSNESCSCEY